MSDHDAKQTYINFDEYIRQGEPSQREAAYAWSTAIGLQAVDGLKTSDYLNELARRNIEGEITMVEVDKLLDDYYKNKKNQASTRTSLELVPVQAQDKYPIKFRTSSGQARDKLQDVNYDVLRLIKVIGINKLSVKDMLNGLELKGRDNFLNVYLTPAINEGYVRLLFPDKPHHPRQKYLLTTKGVLLYNDIKEK